MNCLRPSLALWVGFVLPVVAAPAAASGDDLRSDSLDRHLTELQQRKHFNGTALIAQGDEILLHRGYGYADFEWRIPADQDTRYRIGSITKQFSAMAAAILDERGDLAVEDSVADYFEDVPEHWADVTIEDLILHTSGIPDYEEWFGGYSTQRYSDFMSAADPPARILERARPLPLDFEPGERFHYSNTAYVLLGYLLESASGQTYEELLHEEIFVPLGMDEATQDRHEQVVPHRASGYTVAPGRREALLRGQASDADLIRANFLRMGPPQAEGGMLMTARDLFSWCQALDDRRLVSESTYETIFSPGQGDYGYGWFIRRGRFGLVHEHSGGLPGFSAYLRRLPESGITIILLSNLEFTHPTTVDELCAILLPGR